MLRLRFLVGKLSGFSFGQYRKKFLFSAVIKFFGHLSRLYPKECCEGYPLFLSSVFDLVLNYMHLEVGQRLLAFDTLGLIASTPDGKRVLEKHGK